MSPERHPHASAINLQIGARIALFGLAINIMLASVKIVAGFFGNAYVLIADGIESAMDVGGSIVIWGGLKVAARPPDPTHPYGHGKAEPIAAVIVRLASWRLRLAWHSKCARNLSAASWTCALHARGPHRSCDCEGNFVSICHSVRPEC
jgi:hypothetical protein